MCGEYESSIKFPRFPSGSPPHVWGIRSLAMYEAGERRITPTCVGNTRLYRQIQAHFQDHPHMCGEYPNSEFLKVLTAGSPPHVWGILKDPSIGAIPK